MRGRDVKAGLIIAVSVIAVLSLWTNAPIMGQIMGLSLRWSHLIGIALGGYLAGK